METQPEVIRGLEGKLVPLVLTLITDGGAFTFEYLEHALSITAYLTYYSEGMSTQVWAICGPLLIAFRSWAVDYIGDIAIPLINFMAKVKHLQVYLNFKLSFAGHWSFFVRTAERRTISADPLACRKEVLRC